MSNVIGIKFKVLNLFQIHILSLSESLTFITLAYIYYHHHESLIYTPPIGGSIVVKQKRSVIILILVIV